ncbi:MAG: MazG nucleotide pyrophosphohydrolase domain-containing protein [Candidatus Hydrogenedentota bacterium]
MENLPHLHKLPRDENDWFAALIALARYLRSPEGCPWDRKQRAADFARYAAEETQEFIEACAKHDNGHMAEEFGDSFFTLLAAAAAAEEEGLFRLEDALRGIHEKMVRRHGHVFGADRAATAEDAVEIWKRVKVQEKAHQQTREQADE